MAMRNSIGQPSEDRPSWTKPLLIGGGALLLLVIVMARRSAAPNPADAGGGSSSGGPDKDGTWLTPDGEPLPIPQVAQKLATSHFTKTGPCEIAWGDSGKQVALAGHVADFFAPALAYVRANGASGLEGVTNAIYALFLPGCPTRPQLLRNFDLDAALAGSLPVASQTAFAVARTNPTAQLYLTIRAIMAGMLAAGK